MRISSLSRTTMTLALVLAWSSTPLRSEPTAKGTAIVPTQPESADSMTEMTALDRYVAAPDPSFHFKLLQSQTSPKGTLHILEMTSQTWRSAEEVNHPEWKHWIAIAIPKEVKSDTAALMIIGGNNDRPAPDGIRGDLAQAAIATGSITAELWNVPNQPLIFNNDGIERKEDAIIAYTWDKFLRTGDETWPARLPMTKSAVRAMDAITAFCASPEAGNHVVDKFVISGASKRGWTTWTAAAVDKRVVGIIPIVIDVLNMKPSMLHHYAAYGFWAPAIKDYTQSHIMDWFGTPQFEQLRKIEDPYEYRSRLTMPKLLLNACGDQFFLPDSSQFYFHDLPGQNYLRYVPNTDHSMKNSDMGETWLAFYQALLTKEALPRFTWTLEKGRIRVNVTDLPESIALWQATNPKARDFRLETLGTAWTSTPLKLQDGVIEASVPSPEQGWTAFMVELTYHLSSGRRLKLTTSVQVTPENTDYQFSPNSTPQKP